VAKVPIFVGESGNCDSATALITSSHLAYAEIPWYGVEVFGKKITCTKMNHSLDTGAAAQTFFILPYLPTVPPEIVSLGYVHEFLLITMKGSEIVIHKPHSSENSSKPLAATAYFYCATNELDLSLLFERFPGLKSLRITSSEFGNVIDITPERRNMNTLSVWTRESGTGENSWFGELRVLNLMQVTDFNHIIHMRELTHLKFLAIRGYGGLVDIGAISALVGLQELDISGTRVRDFHRFGIRG